MDEVAYWAIMGLGVIAGVLGTIVIFFISMKVDNKNQEHKEDDLRNKNFWEIADLLSTIKFPKENSLLWEIYHLWGNIKKQEIHDKSMIIFDHQEVLGLVDKLYDVSLKKLKLNHHITKQSSGIPRDMQKKWNRRSESLVRQVQENVVTLEKILETFKVISLEQIELEEHFDLDTFDELNLDVRLLQDQLEARLEVARGIDDELGSLGENGEEEFLEFAEEG
jgi:hypothetical protein